MPISFSPEPSQLVNSYENGGRRMMSSYVPQLDVHDSERLLDELAHRVRLASGKDEVLRALLLQHAPHALHVVGGYVNRC